MHISYTHDISFSPDTTAYTIAKKIHDNNDKACLLMVRYELPVFIMCSHMCMYVCIHVQYKVNLCPVFMICLQIFNTGIISHTCSFNEIGGLKLHTANLGNALAD